MKALLAGLTLLALATNAFPQSCPTADDTYVQGLLDAAAAAGGGTVTLDARTYVTCLPLIVGTNVHLRGAGRGATIIRGITIDPYKLVGGADVYASIAAVAAKNVSIADLTIDHFTHGRNGNALAFLPSGSNFSGTVTTNALAERVEVIGSPNHHAYLMWNLRGQHVKFLNNWIDGKSSSSYPNSQEGIESYGGYDVLISGNTVQNIGQTGINIGSAGLAGSETVGVFATDNYLSGCTAGIHLGTSNVNGDQSIEHTHITGNVIVNSREVGIDVAVWPGSHVRNLDIAHNTIRNTGPGGGLTAAGIMLRSEGGVAGGTAIVSNTIQDNHIEKVWGQNAHGIRLMSYPNVRLVDNTIVDTQTEGLWVVDSNDLEIVGNRVEKAGWVPIYVGTGNIAGLVVEGNRIVDWSPSTSAILVLGARFGAIRDNILQRSDAVRPGVVSFDAASCGMAITGNLSLYSPAVQNPTMPACP